jgi:hypothetical protein
MMYMTIFYEFVVNRLDLQIRAFMRLSHQEKTFFLWQIMYMNLGLCTSAITTGICKNSIFGKLEHFYTFKKPSS